ncbi:MAG: aminotransferase class V-fold PLP-dependent enzyme [Oscillospiraceae bacterium]|nr:aminotransferase class V-fold PLP-dependent enzyme [Oscillospiraceae bacterium]
MIYFDAAATTLEKPDAVRIASARAMGSMSSPGRGGHPASRAAEETAYRCRCEAAELFGMQEPEHVIFTGNATHALNIAIGTVVAAGSRVIVSGYEHNAVTRPLHAVPDLHVTVVDTPPFDPEGMAAEFETAISRGADAVICNHVSNVFGCVQPVEEIARSCRRHGVPLIVDASQSAGVLPVRMDEWGAAFVAMPGHKGLYGPQGTGLLLCGMSAQPILFGGTGSASRVQDMPEELPDRLEAGTHNMPGIAGLLEGIRFVRRKGTETIADHARHLTRRCALRLRELPGVRLFAAEDPARQAGVLSFTVDGRDPEELAEQLARRGIAVRAGLQCAPLAHQTVGTLPDGTVRVSFSAFNTAAQVDRFSWELRAILREKVTL